ncbi:hypothetical protein AOLI_G00008530 [Acnodon oligacanthus]
MKCASLHANIQTWIVFDAGLFWSMGSSCEEAFTRVSVATPPQQSTGSPRCPRSMSHSERKRPPHLNMPTKLLVYFLLLSVFRACRLPSVYSSQTIASEEEEYDDVTVNQMLAPRTHETDATQILNNLLKEYDKKLRPDIGGEWRFQRCALSVVLNATPRCLQSVCSLELDRSSSKRADVE